MTRRDLKIASYAHRLLEMFPNWTTEEGVHAATRIIETSEEMASQMADEFAADVAADIASLPTTRRRGC